MSHTRKPERSYRQIAEEETAVQWLRFLRAATDLVIRALAQLSERDHDLLVDAYDLTALGTQLRHPEALAKMRPATRRAALARAQIRLAEKLDLTTLRIPGEALGSLRDTAGVLPVPAISEVDEGPTPRAGQGGSVATRLTAIGNSQGVRIPKPLLQQSGLGPEVELVVDRDRIVIRPARRPRDVWDEAFRAMASRDDDALLDDELLSPTEWDREEWEW
jgi:antitoxin MazE